MSKCPECGARMIDRQYADIGGPAEVPHHTDGVVCLERQLAQAKAELEAVQRQNAFLNKRHGQLEPLSIKNIELLGTLKARDAVITKLKAENERLRGEKATIEHELCEWLDTWVRNHATQPNSLKGWWEAHIYYAEQCYHAVHTLSRFGRWEYKPHSPRTGKLRDIFRPLSRPPSRVAGLPPLPTPEADMFKKETDDG